MAHSLQGGTPAQLQMSGCSSRLDSSFDPGNMSMHSTVDCCVMCFSMWAMRASTALRISEGEMDSWSAAGNTCGSGRGTEQVCSRQERLQHVKLSAAALGWGNAVTLQIWQYCLPPTQGTHLCQVHGSSCQSAKVASFSLCN